MKHSTRWKRQSLTLKISFDAEKPDHRKDQLPDELSAEKRVALLTRKICRDAMPQFISYLQSPLQY